MPAGSGRYPSGQRGQTVNLLAYAFGGSNPPLPTTIKGHGWLQRKPAAMNYAGGNSSAVERQPSKLGVAGSNPVSRSIALRGEPRSGGEPSGEMIEVVRGEPRSGGEPSGEMIEMGLARATE